jgi:PKD repeat protein
MKSLKILTPALLAFAVVLAACTSSPSEPKQTPTTPVPPVPVTTYSITVTASPNQLTAGVTTSSSTITVTVRRTDTGQAPPDLTPVTLTTSLGEFGSVGSNNQSVTLQLLGGQATAVLFPGPSQGTATVKAQLSQSAGATNVQIGPAPAFFVGSVQPSLGNPQGGDQVKINGSGFASPVRVTFGNAAATVRSVSPTQIVAVVPSATAAGVTVGVGMSVPVPVGVTINANQTTMMTDMLAAGFTYAYGGGAQQPQVFSVSPASGTNDGGTRVTINGTGFVAPVQVFFSAAGVSLEATVLSVTASQIIITTPAARGFGQALANSTVDILIKNSGTGFQTTSTGAFRFGSKVIITSFSPGQLAYNDTTTLITILGQGFESPASASIDKVAARVLSVTGTEIVVQSPGIRVTSCSDVSGPVGVVNINTGDGDDTASGDGPMGNFIYTVPLTAITGVSPSAGSPNGGTQVTIKGSGIDGNSQVLIGGQTATPVGVVANGIVVTSPPFTGMFLTQTCFVGTTAGTMNLDTPVDIKVTNLASTCTDTSVKAFFYQPTDRSCMTTPVTPPPPPVVPAPVASFTITTSGLQAIFDDTSTGAPFISRTWDFGDGGQNFSTSTNQSVSHPYAMAGTYTVTLTVTNACTTGSCTSTLKQFVTVM